ncbi:MAG: hypothetical protein EBY81_04470 [Verrucomicrobia bacterium]|nr:hypothetical protein [Verrucomicrobiota bacterium]
MAMSIMFPMDDLASPFRIGAIKIWPVHSRPDFSWFIAYDGKPYYFKTKGEAEKFAKALES